MTTSAEDELEWIRPLGSGSDFTPFLQHYGVSGHLIRALGVGESWRGDCDPSRGGALMRQIASGNIGFTGGKGDSVYHYHSVYDSFTWQEK